MEIGLLLPILAILVLLFMSGFFSGSETAMTAASKVRLSTKEKEGDKRAALVNKIREKKDRLIGALLLGNNLVNILASALATSVLIKIFGEAGVVYATLVMTLLVLIFAEVLPKTYALHHAETMSMKIAPIIRVVVFVFAPITEAVTWIVRQVLRVFGVDLFKVKTGSHLELLKGAIEMHDGPGVKTQDQRAMLRSILDLADVDIEEIMIHRKNVTMIDADTKIAKIIEAVLDSPFTRLPVWKDDTDNIIGVIHTKQILKQMHSTKSISKITLDSIMMEPRFVPESTHLYDQLQNFRENKEHFAIVVDEYGAFMGIVTMEDILEEIVGEIDDEHDQNVAGVRKLAASKNGDQYVIDGTVTIRDLNREFNWDLPDEDYATIAGLVIHESQMIPDMGQSFVFHSFRFDIMRRQRNQITKIRVTPPKPEHSPEGDQD